MISTNKIFLSVGISMISTFCYGQISDATLLVTETPMAQPAAGQVYTDPDFNTQMVRISETSTSGGDFSETHVYSQLQAFSPQNDYVLLISASEANGNIFVVRDMTTYQIVYSNASLVTPRWDPEEKATLIHFDRADNQDLILQSTDIESGTTTDVSNLSDYISISGVQSFDEVSRDGRWLAGIGVRRSDNASVIFTYDIDNLSFGAEFSVASLYSSGTCAPDPQWGEVEPDWVGVSPLGNYLVIQWAGAGTDRCNGLETFDINTGAFVGRVIDAAPHGDLGIDSLGNEFFMGFETHPTSGAQAISVRQLPGTATSSTPNYVHEDPNFLGVHISCQGPAGGPCLVSTATDVSDSPEIDFALESEIFTLGIDGRVSRLAHTRSSACGYWTVPRASISYDGKLAIFASDYRNTPCVLFNLGNPDPYVVYIDTTSSVSSNSHLNQSSTIDLVTQGQRIVATSSTNLQSFAVYDLSGRSIYYDKPRSSFHEYIIDSAGVYIIEVSDATGKVTKKVVVLSH